VDSLTCLTPDGRLEKRTYVPGKLFLVVADTTNLVTDLRVEVRLL
jgi:hypothetical protein